MAGTVIEILSTRKLVLLFLALLSLLITFFLIGGIIAPRPSDATIHTLLNCKVDKVNGKEIVARHNCNEVHDLHGSEVSDTAAGQIVFIQYIPRPHLEMIPWFQYLLGLLQVKVLFDTQNEYKPGARMMLDVRIYYSDETDYDARMHKEAWKPLVSCQEIRPLQCIFNHTASEEYQDFEYDCDIMHLFQFGSVPHKHYLVNLRLPTDPEPASDFELNHGLGKVSELSVIAIRQTGGFTKVWLCLKSALSVIMIFPVVWFWRRISLLERKPLLIEKAIFSLGISMLFLNLPLELISIFFEASWMLFFTDIRQGFFYSILLSFWIIFVGEHLMDQAHRNKLSSYKWQLGAIFTSTMALLAFDIAERGMQMVNPCSTVWTHHNFAMALIIVASIGGCIYFLLLLYMVFKVFRTISYKQRFLLAPQRQKRFKSIVFRFRLLMVLSVATAGLTVTFYVLSQKYDGLLDWGEHSIEVSSAFFTGVYGLWNIYIFLVLSVYAPSHKQFDNPMDHQAGPDSRQELIQLNSTEPVQSEISDQTRILDLAQQKERED